VKPGVPTLKELPLLASLEPRWLELLNDAADLVRLGPDEMLFNEGERSAELTFLLGGQVLAVNALPNGENAPIDVLLPVRPLCLPAVLLGLPTPVGMLTATSVRLVVIPVSEVQAVIRKVPACGLRFLDWALAEAQEIAREISRLKLRSSAQRLAEFLLGQVEGQDHVPARFVLPFEKRLLAAKIGCSQENLSRAFAALRRLGVETQRAAVVMRDLSALRAYVGSGSPPG
jgi:CRP-like cAMP-binding protein